MHVGARVDRALRSPFFFFFFLFALRLARDGLQQSEHRRHRGWARVDPSERGGWRCPSACLGTPVVMAKRVVRLSEYQLFNSYTSLFGASATAIITGNEGPPPIGEREFPPISGDIGVSESLLGKYDRLAQSAMTYVSQNEASLTPCGAMPSDKVCVQQSFCRSLRRRFGTRSASRNSWRLPGSSGRR